MNVKILNINYIVNGLLTEIHTKMFYKHNENKIQDIYFEFTLGKNNIKSQKNNSMEYAIKSLQKSLPSNINMACCQSCNYGNFCPYGDNENEIFCLKDIILKDEQDVCEFFVNNIDCIQDKRKSLLGSCKDYKPISQGNYYTYNDWE
ncbi:hypothetical protein [Romboutsia lituseburensis]|uniref:hypothetical protein n=1 Tax=Romboutsia lituseburensis TaxID=1537 RepID=UPI00215A9BCC|nr:hypothetical protein [Romboutsia lituseburensis]MCR8746911.1 hypothetical protein [Romboutsia lituseburensis]